MKDTLFLPSQIHPLLTLVCDCCDEECSIPLPRRPLAWDEAGEYAEKQAEHLHGWEDGSCPDCANKLTRDMFEVERADNLRREGLTA